MDYVSSHLPKSKGKPTPPPEVITLANNPPTSVIAAFADGSALGNPGPCGAGVHLILPLEAGTVTDSIALGAGDNNAGEVAGLLQALRLVERARERGLFTGHPPLLLFTDSLLVVGALEWGWSLRNMPNGTRALRVAYRAALAAFPVVRLYWVKGHANIIYNEVVDKEAKLGAAFSRDAPPGTRFPRHNTRWTLALDPALAEDG
jgi:ribonuclease HI